MSESWKVKPTKFLTSMTVEIISRVHTKMIPWAGPCCTSMSDTLGVCLVPAHYACLGITRLVHCSKIFSNNYKTVLICCSLGPMTTNKISVSNSSHFFLRSILTGDICQNHLHLWCRYVYIEDIIQYKRSERTIFTLK